MRNIQNTCDDLFHIALANQYNNIDWDVLKYARTKLPFDRKIWMSKQVSGFYGTGVTINNGTLGTKMCVHCAKNLKIIFML